MGSPSFLSALLPLLAACAAARSSRSPAPEIGAPLPVTWEARLGADGIEDATPPSKTEPRSSRRIEVRCSLYRLEGRAALALPDHPAAWKGDGGALERILATNGKGPAVAPRTSPRLVLLDGMSGSAALLDPTSYVGAFEGHWSEGAWVADPVVRTVHSGLLVEARAAFLENREGIDLSVAIALADLVTPTAKTEALLVAAGAPVTVESPVVREQRLTSAARLAPGERLIVGCPDAARRRARWLAVFEARAAERVVVVEGNGP